MEKVCEDGAQYQNISNQAKLFMARLHTTDITLIPATCCSFYNTRFKDCMCECHCLLIVVIGVSACSQAMSSA